MSKEYLIFRKKVHKVWQCGSDAERENGPLRKTTLQLFASFTFVRLYVFVRLLAIKR